MTTNTPATASANAVAALGNLKQGLQNVQSNIHTAGGDPILRMGRDGVWIYGAENVEVEDGSLWAGNPLSLRQGFVCWKQIPEGSKEKPELLGEELLELVTIAKNPTALADLKARLPDFGHPWAEITVIDFRCISGEDEGEQVVYKPSSTGGLRALKELTGLIIEAIDDHPETPVPVVTLGTDSYQHKQYGKTYVPVLDVAKWIGMDGVASDEPETPAQTAPTVANEQTGQANGRRRQAAPAQQEQVEDDEQEDLTVAQQPAQQAEQGGTRRRRRAA